MSTQEGGRPPDSEEFPAPDEVLEIAPGMLLLRKGRFIQAISQQSTEQAAHFRQVMREFRAELPAKIRRKVQELRELIATVPVEQLLCLLTFHMFVRPYEVADTHEPDRPAVFVEYPTWLALTSPEIRLTGQLDEATYDRVRTLLDELISLTHWRYSLEHLADSDVPTALDTLRYEARVHSLFVRVPAYPQHLRDQLRNLFSPFATDLKRFLGFDAQEALAAISAIERRLEQALNELLGHVGRFREDCLARLRDTSEAELTWVEREGLNRHRSASDPAASAGDSLAMSLLVANLPSAYRVDAASIAKDASVSVQTAGSILDAFSIGTPLQEIGDSAPSVYEPLESRPLVRLPNGACLCHLSFKLLWAVRACFEAALKKDAAAWARYDAHRSRYLENRLVELVSSPSRHAKGWSRLRYRWDDGAGEVEYDLDGLVVCDTILFLVEGKAGEFSLAAWRGAESSTVEELQALIGDAQEQALRAARFIGSAPRVTMTARKGQTVTLERAAFTRVFVVTGTLEPLGPLATKASNLARIGILSQDVLPWSVFELDLRVITEHAEGMGQLVNYLDRRLRVERQQVHAVDELDWFAYYLRHGLYFTEFPEGGKGHFVVGTYTEVFDHHYAPKQGSTAAPKARQPIPEPLRELMLLLEAQGPNGYVEAVSFLLEGDAATRERLSALISDRRERARKVAFAACRVGMGDHLFCYVAADPAAKDAPDPATILAGYTRASKYHASANAAVGVYQNPRVPDQLLVCLEFYPWQEDRELAAGAAHLLETLSSHQIQA